MIIYSIFLEKNLYTLFFIGANTSNTALTGWVGGGAVLVLVVGVIGGTVLMRRNSGRKRPQGPKSGVTSDPTIHLNGLQTKRFSERSSTGRTPPQVSQASIEDELCLGPKSHSVQSSTTKETVAGQGRQGSTENKSPVQAQEVEGPPLPEHTILIKNKDLKANAKDLVENKDVLEAEYRSLLGYVNKNINKTRTVAKLDENKEHNRYMDIGTPYPILYE